MAMLDERGPRARVEIYTGRYCSYCEAAKRLLQQKGLEYQEYHVDNDVGSRERMSVRAHGRRSVPQIFVNDRHVGGYMDLAQLDRRGQLDALLRAPPGADAAK